MTYATEQADKPIFRPNYSPAPEIPGWFSARLTAIGGTNPMGEPRLQVVWGMDARHFENGDPAAIKYMSPNDWDSGFACWILEQWAEPKFFGNPDDWERHRYFYDATGTKVDALGPYPSRGAYILVQPLCTPDGEMLPLTEQVADYISWLMQGAVRTPDNSYTAATHRAERAEKVRRESAEKSKRVQKALDEQYERSAVTADSVNTAATRVYSLPSGERRTESGLILLP